MAQRCLYGVDKNRFAVNLAKLSLWLLTLAKDKPFRLQVVGTWPDIFGYGLGVAACVAWHRMLNDTLADWAAT